MDPKPIDRLDIVNHGSHMVDVIRSVTFDRWLAGLKDHRALALILLRLDRLARGNDGDIKAVGGGVLELRIDHGPGYRVYLVKRGTLTVILLAGGTKRDQDRDIAKAKALARALEI